MKKFIETTHNNYSPWVERVVELSEEEIKEKVDYMKLQGWVIGKEGEIYDVLEFGYKAHKTYKPVK